MAYDAKKREATYRWRRKYPSKWRAYSRGWFAKQTAEVKARYRRDNVLGKKLLLAMCKDIPCTDCGRRFPLECMDFDHVRGTKKRNVAHMTHKCSFAAIEAEIAKCEVVCANCHRIRTHRRNRW